MAIDVVDALRARFAEAGEAPALAYRGEVKSFNWLSSEIEEATTWLTENGIKQGQTVLLTSDYTPKTVAILFWFNLAENDHRAITSNNKKHH